MARDKGMQSLGVVLARYLNSTHQPPTTETDQTSDQNEVCQFCHGIGFVHPQDVNGVDYSRVIPCSCTLEAARKLQASPEYNRRCGGNPEQTFENFKAVNGVKPTLDLVRAWVDPRSTFAWLLLYGSNGNGKSHMCNAALATLLQRGVNARLITAAAFIASLRTGMNDHTTDALMSGYQSLPCLIIDDLGMGHKRPDDPSGEWEWARIEELLVARYDSLKPTMVVTNLEWRALPARLTSRFNDRMIARIVRNEAPDYRRTK